jgi:hypothetical protein
MRRRASIGLSSSAVALIAILAAGRDLRAQDLKGEYWENATIPAAPGVPAGAANHLSSDAVIDYDDDAATATPNFPAPLASLDNFVVRWSGFVMGPTTGTVTFETLSDDGVQLSVGGSAIITNWTDHGPTPNTGTFNMTQGIWYPIQLLFYERGVTCRIRLQWSYTGQALQIIPGANQAQTVPAPAQPVLSGTAGDLQVTFNTLSWTFAGTASNFTIYRSTTSGVQGTSIATPAGNVTTYTDMTANQYGTTYYYSITATNGVEGPASSPQVALTPQPPAPRTQDHDEGFLDGKCACGSTVADPSGLFAGIVGLALLLASSLRRGSA